TGSGALTAPGFTISLDAAIRVTTPGVTTITYYAVDSAGNKSASGSTTVGVRDGPAMTLTADKDSVTVGQLLTLTATVALPATNPPAISTVRVTFYDGTTVLGAPPLGWGGTATLTTRLSGSGVRTLRAFYPGDPTLGTGQSEAFLNETVSSLPNEGFIP